jgi:hypothetical protein
MADLEASAGLWRLADVYDCGYSAGSLSLGNYRLDPAPKGVQPRLTETEALKVFSEGPFGDHSGRRCRGPLRGSACSVAQTSSTPLMGTQARRLKSALGQRGSW